MTVEWTKQAKTAVRATIKYVEDNFGSRSKLSLAREIVMSEHLLASHPFMGIVEPLLEDRSITYRSLIVKRLNKMVYRIDNDCIIIVDFWNLRRNPDKLRNQVQ